MTTDAERLLKNALNAGLVNLQVSTALFVGNEDISYTEILFGEPRRISNYFSTYYLVDGQEVLTLEPQHLDYFLACNATVPQVARLSRGQTTIYGMKHKSSAQNLDKRQTEERRVNSPQVYVDKVTSDRSNLSSQTFDSDQVVIHEQSLTQDRTQKEKVKENTSQASAYSASESTSKEYISEPLELQETGLGSDPNITYEQDPTDNSQIEPESTSKEFISEPLEQQETGPRSHPNIAYEQDPTDNSQVKPIKSTSDPVKSFLSTETSGKVLKLMHEASEEKHKLQLIHVVESNNVSILLVLPLILQRTITFGVGYSETVEIIKTVQHLSKKWLIIKNEKTSVELLKVFSSHTTPLKNHISVQSTISARDLALLSHKTEEKAVPFAWYFLCHSIQNAFKEVNRKMMSINEVSHIAKKCLISVDELPKILSYLHETGLLLYYGDILPNVVFEDASLIVKTLSLAILNSQKNGIIHESSLRQIEDMFFDDLFTFEDAIKLLKNLAIISSINKQLFCMPTLFTSVIDEKHIREQGNIPPLHIQYPVAPGVFEYLLCYLTSEQNEILWPWKIYNKTELSLYKNCAELTLPGYDSIITLLQSSDCIKVYLKFIDSQPPVAKIRQSIFTGVKKANSLYSYPYLEIKFGFSCICGSVNFEHTMIYHKQDQHLNCACDLNGETFPLSHNQKVWLEEGKTSYLLVPIKSRIVLSAIQVFLKTKMLLVLLVCSNFFYFATKSGIK